MVGFHTGGDWDVKKEATWVVSNILSGGTAAHVTRLVEFGAVQPLVDLLDKDDAKIVLVALDALEVILKLGAVGGVAATTLVDEAGGVEAVEGLQHHENAKIYEKSVALIETYFGCEQEDAGIAPAVDGNTFKFGLN